MIIKRQFKEKFKTHAALVARTQDYPLDELDFAVVQQEVAKTFHQVAVNRWQDSITRNVSKILASNFKQTRQSFLVREESKINPYILRFLKSIYQVQVNHLFAKYERELKNYIEFLLRFANACADFKSKQSYLDYKLHTFDVAYSETCLITSEVTIEVIKAARVAEVSQASGRNKVAANPFKAAMKRLRPVHATQRLQTAPSLENIYMQLYRVLNGISSQFLGIPTVHSSIYKFADLGRKTIQVSTDLGDKEFNQDSILEEFGFRSMLEGISQDTRETDLRELYSKDQVFILRK